MTRISIMQMCTAVHDTLEDAASLVLAQNYDELTETIPDTPMIQVWFSTSSVDSQNVTDRETFGAGVRVSSYDIFVDVYAKRRANLAEDVAIATRVIDELEAILEAQDNCPPFGLTYCKSYRWETTFTVNLYNNGKEYAGGRIIITLGFH